MYLLTSSNNCLLSDTPDCHEPLRRTLLKNGEYTFIQNEQRTLAVIYRKVLSPGLFKLRLCLALYFQLKTHNTIKSQVHTGICLGAKRHRFFCKSRHFQVKIKDFFFFLPGRIRPYTALSGCCVHLWYVANSSFDCLEARDALTVMLLVLSPLSLCSLDGPYRLPTTMETLLYSSCMSTTQLHTLQHTLSS